MDPITANDTKVAVEASQPGLGSLTVVPDDDEDLPFTSRSLYVTVAGDVTFIGADGEEDTWTVPNNFTIPVQMTRVLDTGTTATGLRAIK